MQLTYLHYILQQPKQSIIGQMWDADAGMPTKRDWRSNIIKLLQIYNINLTLEEISDLKRHMFKSIVDEKVFKITFHELIEKQKQGKKGKIFVFKKFEMVDFLAPKEKLSSHDQKEIFSLISEMNNLPSNFGKDIYCETKCGKKTK